jgi:hypothetical protein
VKICPNRTKKSRIQLAGLEKAIFLFYRLKNEKALGDGCTLANRVKVISTARDVDRTPKNRFKLSIFNSVKRRRDIGGYISIGLKLILERKTNIHTNIN